MEHICCVRTSDELRMVNRNICRERVMSLHTLTPSHPHTTITRTHPHTPSHAHILTHHHMHTPSHTHTLKNLQTYLTHPHSPPSHPHSPSHTTFTHPHTLTVPPSHPHTLTTFVCLFGSNRRRQPMRTERMFSTPADTKFSAFGSTPVSTESPKPDSCRHTHTHTHTSNG